MDNIGFAHIYDQFEQSISSAALKEVTGHWRDICASGRLPSWSDIRPSAIKQHLSIVWCYDYLPEEDDFVGRLAGNGITGVSNKPFKGSRLSELRPNDKYPRSLIRATRVMQEPALYHGQELVYKTADSSGVGERVVMPLGRHGAQPPGIFGATEYKKLDEWNSRNYLTETEDWFSLAGLIETPKEL